MKMTLPTSDRRRRSPLFMGWGRAASGCSERKDLITDFTDDTDFWTGWVEQEGTETGRR
jgi:hypothetical protein